MSEEEKYLHEMIRLIHADYQKQIQPYVDRLVALKRLELPSFYYIDKKLSNEELGELRSVV